MRLLKGVEPEEARLFTWELATSYDEVPSSRDLEDAFAREFPETCSRLKEYTPPRRFVAWPLISFNASEGRLSRYLVAIVDAAENSRRRLPRQIWRYALADAAIRKMGADDASEDNSGNYLCYGLEGDVFYLMVFFEGRLCHWLEEPLAVKLGEDCATALERRVERFRQYLQIDSLFSRAKGFAEILLEGCFSERLFRTAASDSIWQKKLSREDNGSPNRKGGRNRWFVFFAVAGILAWFGLSGTSVRCDLEDVVPVELIPAPEYVELNEAEVRESLAYIPAKTSTGSPRCVLPELRVMGVIDGKLATVALDTGHVKTKLLVSVGDSLGSYRVRSVAHGLVSLECGTSVVDRGVGDVAK